MISVLNKVRMVIGMLTIVFFVGILPSCDNEWTNSVDENSPDFDPPIIIVDKKYSNIGKGDTIHFCDGTLTLKGNKDISRFRLKMDNNDWSTWGPEGTYDFNNIEDGNHSVLIETMYEGGERTIRDTVMFTVQVKGYIPEFPNSTDTIISLFPGQSLVLTEKAIGAEPMKKSWLKIEEVEKVFSGDTFYIDTFKVGDTGTYVCMVTNEYGEDTSRLYRLKYLAPKGSITGYLVDVNDSSKIDSAEITLLPMNEKIISGKYGEFAMNGLSEGIYSIEITHDRYKDTTFVDIKLSNTGKVDLKKVYLQNSSLYTLKYDGNGKDSGIVPIDSNQYKLGKKIITADYKGLFRKGYSGSGWNTKKEGDGKAYNPGDTIEIAGNITLYAIWSVNKYTVSYNGNGFTTGELPPQEEFDYNQKITAAKIGTLERAGHVFISWNSTASGKGFSVKPDSSFNVPDSNVTLFAMWKALPTYKITYDGNGNDSGEVPVDDTVYYKGKDVTVKGNPGNLTKENLVFAGWNTTPDVKGETYTAGSKFSMPDSAVTLFANWSSKPTYSVTYHGNGNSGGEPPTKVSSESGRSVTVAGNGSLLKTGFVVASWNTNEGGTGKKYEIGNIFTMDTVNIDLYAQWEKAQYTVTYHGNGSTGGVVPSQTKHYHGTEVTIESAGDFQKTGHTFYKWNTDSSGSGIDYSVGDKVVLTSGNVNLFARWTINEYSIVFKTSGGSLIDNQQVKFGDTIAMPIAPIKLGYFFDGWFIDSLCSQLWGFKTKTSDSVTLYAKWVIKDIDGNIYTEVKIGRQVWMVENLRTTRFNDGSSIPMVIEDTSWASLTTPGFCYFNHNTATAEMKWGAFYNGHAVNTGKLAPIGWHVPSDTEWEILQNYLIANGYNWDATTSDNKAAKSLGTKTDWKASDKAGTVGNNMANNNSSGFSALPVGIRFGNGEFSYRSERCNWWSSKDRWEDWCVGLMYDYGGIVNGIIDKGNGLSVRLIRD